MSKSLSLVEKVRRKIARLLFDLADIISPDTVWELSTDFAIDAGFGYCDDCDIRMSDEPRYCR
jgi:hypothetical protein